MWSKPIQMCQTPSCTYVANCAQRTGAVAADDALRRVGAEHDAAALAVLDEVQQAAMLRIEPFEQPIVDRQRRARPAGTFRSSSNTA